MRRNKLKLRGAIQYRSANYACFFLFVSTALMLVACTNPPREQASPSIAVTILPQRQLVQRIAGQRFAVDVLIPPGYSPATYSPAPAQIMRLSHCLVWFRIGKLPFERAWTARILSSHPRLQVVDTSKGADWIVPEKNNHGHAIGVDPHIWLSPRLVKLQSRHILEALVRLDPSHAVEYRARHRRLLEEIEAVDLRIRMILKDLPARRFLVFHPSWAYFARDYDLVQVAIENEGKSPAPADLARTMDRVRRDGLRTVFVQQQFDTEAAEVVAREIGGRVETLDPLAEDWAANMIRTARKLRAALEAGP